MYVYVKYDVCTHFPKKKLESTGGTTLWVGQTFRKSVLKTSILGVYILYTLRHVFWSTKTFENSVEHVYIDVSHREESIHSGFTDCTQLVGKLRVKTAFRKPQYGQKCSKLLLFYPIFGALKGSVW